jgi:hypothetical protein
MFCVISKNTDILERIFKYDIEDEGDVYEFYNTLLSKHEEDYYEDYKYDDATPQSNQWINYEDDWYWYAEDDDLYDDGQWYDDGMFDVYDDDEWYHYHDDDLPDDEDNSEQGSELNTTRSIYQNLRGKLDQ